jgi:hypothetical protein
MAYLNINPDLFLGSQELNRLVKFLDEDGFRKLFLQNSSAFGIINNITDGQLDNFQVTAGTNVGTIKINDGIAINDLGQIITFYETDNIALTDDSNWYWVVAEYQDDIRELGECSIDGNGNLYFAGGGLLDVLRGLPNNPVKIAFTNAAINIQQYEVLEVIDNENAILTGNFLPETNLRMTVIGAFTPDIVPPAGSESPFRYNGSTITIAEETVLNTPPALVAGRQFTLARVQRTGAAVVIQDKRTAIYQSTADSEIGTLALANNPLIGVEAVKFDNNLTPREHNLVHIAWTFRSSNWTIDSSTNRVTLIAGEGGLFKDTTYFTDGDFDGWRLYTKDGSYAVIRQSTKAATQINLILDVLDPDKFIDTTQQLIVAPNADEIELVFDADPADATNLMARRVTYHINNGVVIVPVVVYKTPSASYNVKYRYKSLKVWNQLTAIPSDVVGYYVEADFDVNGTPTASARQPYTSHATNGFITLILATNAYYNRIASIETGDLLGVEYVAIDSGVDPIIDFEVGQRRSRVIITNDDNLEASDSDFGAQYTLTADVYLNLISSLSLVNGNQFTIQIRGDYAFDTFDIFIVQDYVNPGDPGIQLYQFIQDDLDQARVDNLIFNLVWDGTRWVSDKIVGVTTPVLKVSPDSSPLSVRVIDIGDWDMDADANVIVACPGILTENIRGAHAVIRSDAGAFGGSTKHYPIQGVNASTSTQFGTIASYGDEGSEGAVTLAREPAEFFDGITFDSTSYNRGWLTIFYVA